MDSDLISIIVPVFNAEKFLHKCIEIKKVDFKQRNLSHLKFSGTL